jgi:RNA polymerase sigma-70 factor, ECF subfamily
METGKARVAASLEEGRRFATMSTATIFTTAADASLSNPFGSDRRAAQRFAGKRKRSSRPQTPAIEMRERKPDGASLTATIHAAQQGDASAFEVLYHLHAGRVYGLCLRMLGDPVDAEDLAQEAFLQLFRKIQTFRGESAFSSWLHRLTANVVLMSFRRKRPMTTSLDEMIHGDDDNDVPRHEIGVPDLRLSGLCDRINLQAAIENLPEGYRLMFLLHDVHGYEHNEIAQILDCSIGNSKSQLHKARKRLRELLQRAERSRLQYGVPARA